MRSSSASETEILLGNKHLLGIFFVIAILLGVAFTGGYMVGRNSTEKRPATVSAAMPDAATPTTPSSLETHSVPPSPGSAEGRVRLIARAHKFATQSEFACCGGCAAARCAVGIHEAKTGRCAGSSGKRPGRQLPTAVRPNLFAGRRGGAERSRWDCRCAEQERISRAFGA